MKKDVVSLNVNDSHAHKLIDSQLISNSSNKNNNVVNNSQISPNRNSITNNNLNSAKTEAPKIGLNETARKIGAENTLVTTTAITKIDDGRNNCKSIANVNNNLNDNLLNRTTRSSLDSERITDHLKR